MDPMPKNKAEAIEKLRIVAAAQAGDIAWRGRDTDMPTHLFGAFVRHANMNRWHGGRPVEHSQGPNCYECAEGRANVGQFVDQLRFS